jgi:hypothetical protein
MADEDGRITWPALVVGAIAVAAAAWMVLPRVTAQILMLAATQGRLAACAAFVGYAFVPALAVWLVIYFAFVFWRAPSRGFFYAAVLVTIASGIDLIGLAAGTGTIDWPILQNAATVMAPDPVDALIARSRGTLGTVLRPSGGMVMLSTGAPGAAGEPDRHIKALANGITAADKASKAEIEATGFPHFMAPTSFVDVHGLVRVRALLERFGAASRRTTRRWTVSCRTIAAGSRARRRWSRSNAAPRSRRWMARSPRAARRGRAIPSSGCRRSTSWRRWSAICAAIPPGR